MLKKTAFATLVLSVAVIAGWGFSLSRTAEHKDFSPCSETFTFLSDEIDCGSIDEKIEQMVRLDQIIENFIHQEKKAGHASEIAVFFRDLNSRQWFGVNENVNFYPASLAKLPIAMATYKSAEVNRKILELELPITEADIELNSGQHYKIQESLAGGKSYPVRELLRRLLTFSDNAPVNPLMDASRLFRDSVFSDLGVFYLPGKGENDGRWNITAKSYANLFRILYNASYLRPEYSNEILRLLSDSAFKNGLVAGVPEGMKVAHKFGETSTDDEEIGGKLVVLNDCGIIYNINSPYILCVMTRGGDFADMENIIQMISAQVYQSL